MTPSDNVAAFSGTQIAYVGSELELFAEAGIWRAYWQRQISEFIGKRVLEVGAGIGSVARSLAHLSVDRWVALEPDPDMAGRLASLAASGTLPAWCEPRAGTTADLLAGEQFDTVLYADVLEHIEDDRAELIRAARHLTGHGTLIVLAPAHQRLYSSFDAAIGHFRRYTLTELRDLGPPGLTVARARYLDSVGLLASLGNRLVLKQSAPTAGQIRLWDQVMVRASRWLDPVCGFRLGKSALIVWRNAA